MPTEMDAALLAQLKAAYGDQLPAWLEAELSQAPQAIAPETAAACRDAAAGDPVLRAFAERLAARMPPVTTCAHRVLAHELLLASALGNRSNRSLTPTEATEVRPQAKQPKSDPGRSEERPCLMRDLGCGGPCALRCHTNASEETLALLRQATRYIAVSYEFSEPGEPPAEKVKWVKRRHLETMSLERESSHEPAMGEPSAAGPVRK